MTTPNPLQPQGALPKDNKGKNNIRIAVFTILAVHVVLLLGLLMQGCKREEAKNDSKDGLTTGATNLPPLLAETPYHNANNPAPEANTANVIPVPNTVNPAPPTLANTAGTRTALETTAPPLSVPVGPTKEYAVVKGDNYYKIAKAHGVSIKALTQANPGVDPNKIKINQKLQIPEPAPIDHSARKVATTGAADPGAVEGKAHVYQVKSGDSLAKIAKQHGISIQAIQSANKLKTTQIKVGQKLKLPAAKSAVAKGSTAVSSAIPVMATSNAGALPAISPATTPAQ